MRTIWKYVLPSPDVTLAIPAGGVFRNFGEQDSNLCIWVEVDSDAPLQPRPFICVNTGGMVPESTDDTYAVYRGMATVEGIVWHLYEGVHRITPLSQP